MVKENSKEEWLKGLLKKIPMGWQKRRLDQVLSEPSKLSLSEEKKIIKLIEDVKWAEIYRIELPTWIYNIIGLYYFNKQEYLNAASYFKLATKTDKEPYLAYHNYAAALAYLGQQKKDIKTLEESLLTIDKASKEGKYKKKGHVLYQKAWVLDTMWRIGKKKKFKEAIEMYNRSIKLNEEEGDRSVADSARYNSACMFALGKDYKKAKKFLLGIATEQVINLAKEDKDLDTMKTLPEYKTIFK